MIFLRGHRNWRLSNLGQGCAAMSPLRPPSFSPQGALRCYRIIKSHFTHDSYLHHAHNVLFILPNFKSDSLYKLSCRYPYRNRRQSLTKINKRCLNQAPGKPVSLNVSHQSISVSFAALRSIRIEQISTYKFPLKIAGCMAFWCPCIVYGKNKHRNDGEMDPPACTGSVCLFLL